MTPFRITGLPGEQFLALAGLPDAELAARGIKRYVADAKPGYPCRVTLADAEPGERVLLLSHTHQPADGPYQASGPIFVREGAAGTEVLDHVPDYLRTRLLSVRAYDGGDLITDAEVVPGTELEPLLERFLADGRTAYVHIHFARRGCYAARVDRA